jgi:hypothetical protein
MTPEQQMAALVGASPALAVVLLFLINRVWPDLMAARKAERESDLEERKQLIEIVRNNTETSALLRESIVAQTQNIGRLNDSVMRLMYDVREIQAHLQLPRTKE